MSDPANPLDKLSRQELLWLAGILKDACRERLEKNLVSQAFEERLNRRGTIDGHVDPRPSLKVWEPRYRKLLEIATELHAALEGKGAESVAESVRAQMAAAVVRRRGPGKVVVMGTVPKRQSGLR